MTSKEIFDLLRNNSSNDTEFMEVLSLFLSTCASDLKIEGSKHDVYDAADCLMKAAGHPAD